MGRIIKYEISDEDILKLEKVYETSKKKLPPSIQTFDEFLVWTTNVAIKTHIQFASLNEKMMDFLNLPSNVDDAEFGDISKFVTSIFEKETNKKSDDKANIKLKTMSKKN